MTTKTGRGVRGPAALLLAGAGVLVLGLGTVQGSPGSGPNGVPFERLDELMTSINLSLDALAQAVDDGTVATRPNLGPRTASDLVTLRASGLTACTTSGPSGHRFDSRVRADGTSEEFAVPPGKVLIITGLAWRTSGNTAHAGATLRLESATTIATAFFDTQPATASGIAGAVATIPGIAVAPGVGLCLGNSGDSPGAPSGLLYGYLADAGS